MVHSGQCSELLATLGDSTSKALLVLATIPFSVILPACVQSCEKVRGSCSVCVKAAVHVVPVTFCSSVPPDH